MKLKILAILAILANSVFAQNYHDTQGKLEISNGGQANFSIPIAMPPSINSIGPTINLAYISGTASGIAGQGWNINSLSSIARVSTRLDIEGYRDGVDFDQDDKLALDGQYLLLKSGNYWSSGSIYQTEVQSNVKIELQGSGTSMYFIVTAPDGARSWYGNYNGEVASDQTAFYLTRYEDTNGNLITYHYNSSFNSLFISEIRFSANINTNPVPLNKILLELSRIL
ncbi:SpvB/TcaC N-terminal domain-containing protein [Flavobacterium sp.]|uniref:SpvB/TcaC N-terminal domain-containing protein n=1 Tax=Flavobacterium sp. TaxID=239 RepID=UPI00333F8EA1